MRPAELVGTTVCDTYVVEGVIGAGTMGTVLLVRHVRLPRHFAMKVLHGERSADSEVLGRFRREAEIASSLGHPHIVSVMDWNRLPDGTPFLIMEHLRGEDLMARMTREGPMSLPAALELARQVGSALAAAHKNGVVHRDLKPQNIFLCREDRGDEEVEVAKVLDFGISKILGDPGAQTGAIRVMGTPLYMAPEQAMGFASNVDGRADQFALAAILYHALTGQRPFDGASVVEIVFKVMNDEPTPPRVLRPDLPLQVELALLQALRKEREGRFATTSDFVRALGVMRLPTGLTAAAQLPASLGGAGGWAAGGAAGGWAAGGAAGGVGGAAGGVAGATGGWAAGGVTTGGTGGATGSVAGSGVAGMGGVAGVGMGGVAGAGIGGAVGAAGGGVAGGAAGGTQGRAQIGAGTSDGAPVLTYAWRPQIALALVALLAGVLTWGLVRLAGRALFPPVVVAIPVAPAPRSPVPEVRPPVAQRVRLRFAVTPPGAEIYLDGRRVDSEVEVPRGEIGLRLEIRAHGHQPHTEMIVPSGDQRLIVHLSRRRGGTPAGTAPPGSAPPGGGAVTSPF